MNNQRISLPSGKILEIQIAKFSFGTKLYKIISTELKNVDIKFDFKSAKELLNKDVESFKNVFLQLLASDPLEAVIFDCMKSCTYNDVVINRDTFEPLENRPDWLFCAWEVGKANLLPFFENLKSLLPTKSDQNEATPP